MTASLAHVSIDVPNPLQQWIEAQIALGGYDSTSAYLCHLVEQDQERKKREYEHFKSVFDRLGVKTVAEFHALAAKRARELEGDPHEIEVMAFLDSLGDEEEI
ncbi:MAG: hypothetical protein QM537_01850 [Candidatus Symbiobacter sp.]|nr:hypothetical protein [Candidatus Symbiobacter sp.]